MEQATDAVIWFTIVIAVIGVIIVMEAMYNLLRDRPTILKNLIHPVRLPVMILGFGFFISTSLVLVALGDDGNQTARLSTLSLLGFGILLFAGPILQLRLLNKWKAD